MRLASSIQLAILYVRNEKVQDSMCDGRGEYEFESIFIQSFSSRGIYGLFNMLGAKQPREKSNV